MARMAGIQAKRSAETGGSSPSSGEEIAQVAYELFLKRGGTHGQDQQDWFIAEQIVRQRRASGAKRWRG